MLILVLHLACHFNCETGFARTGRASGAIRTIETLLTVIERPLVEAPKA